MARHRSRQPGAQEALATAKKLAAKETHSWADKIAISHLLDEATHELALPPPS
jgi:hypothetical protein